jgi:hypothetical protein
VRKPSITDGGSTEGEGNVYHGPWPERAADASQPAEQPPASGANWMRDADAITSGFVETPASRKRDEFFDELRSDAAARPGDDDLDAFITRAATTVAATPAETAAADGSAALPSDIEVTKPARHIRVNTFGPQAWCAGIAGLRARHAGEHGRRIATAPKRVALSVMAVGIIAALTAVASGPLSGVGKPAPATFAGTRATSGRASKQPSAILPVLRRPTTDRGHSATKAAHRERRDARQQHIRPS